MLRLVVCAAFTGAAGEVDARADEEDTADEDDEEEPILDRTRDKVEDDEDREAAEAEEGVT